MTFLGFYAEVDVFLILLTILCVFVALCYYLGILLSNLRCCEKLSYGNDYALNLEHVNISDTHPFIQSSESHVVRIPS